MLDIKLIREEPEKVKEALQKRGADVGLEEILSLDQARRELLSAIEAKRAERNNASEGVGKLMREAGQAKKEGRSSAELEVEVGKLKERSSGLGKEIAELNNQLRPVEDSLRELLLLVPNIPHETVPVGLDASKNEIIRRVGDPREFGFEPKAHWDIGEDLNIIDFKRAAKIAGARFALYLGAGAQLERALINFMLDIQSREH